MKIVNKILISFCCVIVIGVSLFSFAVSINDSFRYRVKETLKIEQVIDSANAEYLTDVKKEFEEKIGKVSDEKKEIENNLSLTQNKILELEESLNKTSSKDEVEEIQSQIEDLQFQVTLLEQEKFQLENELIELNIKINEISNLLGEKRTQAKMLNLKYNLTVTQRTVIGSTTMDFKGGQLIVVGYIYAKVSNHIGYVNLRVDDNSDTYELTAFDSATSIMSRPFVFCLDGLEAGTHIFSIEVVGQQGTETITIPNYNRAAALFIEI